MSFIGHILGTGLAKTVSAIGDTVKKFVTTDGDRMNMQMELEAILQKRDSEVEQTIRAELEAKEKIMVAEMQQGDNYTKRARPTIIYFGLVSIFLSYMLIPIIQMLLGIEVVPLDLPKEFWVAWGGVVGVYAIGRSAEKRGTRNKVTSFITGN